MSTPSLTLLRQLIADYFSDDELRTLCVDLRLNYDALPAIGTHGKAFEVILALGKQSRLHELVAYVRQVRPNLAVDDLPPAITADSLAALAAESATSGVTQTASGSYIALDEAAGWEAGADLFPAVPPEHLRVVVAARPLAGDADERAWLSRLGWETPGQAACLSLERLTRAGVADVLVQMGNPLDALATQVDVVGQLYELSEGDPLLVQLYVEALLPYGDQAAVLKPEDLLTLKPGLKAYFDRWFEEQRKLWGVSKPLQDRAARGLLDLCATAMGPLTRADILALAPDYFEDDWVVKEAAQAVRRFVVGDGVESGYVFSRPRLAEYFCGEMSPARRTEWHGRFLKYEQDTLAALEAGTLVPMQAPAYAVKYYGAHLDRARAPNPLVYALVCKAWLDAWQAVEGTPAGFLTDVNRAWARAEAEGPGALGQQVLSALCWASCGESERVKSKALAVVCAIGDETSRASALSAVAARLPEGSVEQTQVLGEALAAACATWDGVSRAWALSTVAKRLPKCNTERAKILSEGLEAACTIGNEQYRAGVLSMMVEHLPDTEQALLFQALAAARTFGNECHRANALSAVAKRLPNSGRALLREVLTATRTIRDEGLRSRTLSAMAARLPERSTEQAQVLSEAMEAARAIRNDVSRVRALSAVATRLPDTERAKVLSEALEMTRAVGSESARAEALGAVVEHLQDTERAKVLGEALDAACMIRDEWSRSFALQMVAERLPDTEQGLLNKALAAARAIRDDLSRIKALHAVAGHLPIHSVEQTQVLREILGAVHAIDIDMFSGEWYAAEVLSAVAAWLPDTNRALLIETLEKARAIEVEKYRAVAMGAVAARLPESSAERARVLDEALATARAIEEEYDCAEALSEIAARLPERSAEQVKLLSEAIKAVRAIENEESRAEALSEIAARLPGNLLAAALEVAFSVCNQSESTRVLSFLASRWGEMCQGDRQAEFAKLSATLRAFAKADRKRLLGAIEALLPVIERLGGPQVVYETGHAIIETAKWWP